jgi:outer membrane protein assembly factor BamA
MNKAMTVAWLALALAVVAVPAFAQDPLEGKTIRAIQVAGLDHIKESVVLEQIKSVPGTPYHRATAVRDVFRLDRLGVFGAISVVGVAVDEGVRIDVTLTEVPHFVPAVSVAVTDENGASAGPAVKMTSVKGHPYDVGITTRFGGETLGQFSVVSPNRTHQRLWDSVKLSLSDHYNKLDQFTQRSVDLDTRVGARMSEEWLAGAIFKYYTTGSEVSGVTLDPDNHDAFPSFGAVTEYDNRDSWREPSRGWFASADALWTTGSGNYATMDLDVRRYSPVAARQTIVGAALLTMQSGIDGVDLPTYGDYAIGGENTVRGHGFGSSRGKNQFIATLEYRYSLVPTRTFRVAGFNFYAGLALAAFGDVGSAWSDSDAFSDSVLGGYGIGLRLYIPYVNMIRLDLSFGDGAHGGLGINEKAVAQRNRVR